MLRRSHFLDDDEQPSQEDIEKYRRERERESEGNPKGDKGDKK